jgi:hypothetical protein
MVIRRDGPDAACRGDLTQRAKRPAVGVGWNCRALPTAGLDWAGRAGFSKSGGMRARRSHLIGDGLVHMTVLFRGCGVWWGLGGEGRGEIDRLTGPDQGSKIAIPGLPTNQRPWCWPRHFPSRPSRSPRSTPSSTSHRSTQGQQSRSLQALARSASLSFRRLLTALKR